MEPDMQLNHLLDLVEPSRSVTLLARTKELMQTDPTIINMTGGEPDFDTPKKVCDAAYQAMLAGETHYASPKGDPALREAIAEKLRRENGASYSADQILVTPGGKYGIYAAIQAILNPGDEVLWLTPGYVSYPAIVTLCGGSPVAVHLDYDRDYRITGEALEAAVTEKTRLLILNYPNNPTSRILHADELEEIKAFLRRHSQVLVLSDEIYEKILFDDNRMLSLISDPEFADRVVLINGFSKCMAMTGWRLGYVACPEPLYGAISRIFQHSLSATASFSQKAAIVALDCREEMEEMRASYERRMQIMMDGFADIPNMELKRPEGAFYAWVKFDTDWSAEELCDRLLESYGVAGIPGSAYGEEKYTTVRFCFAAPEERLHEMIRRMHEFSKLI